VFKQPKKLIIIFFILTAGLFAAHFALAQSSDNLLFGGLQNQTGNIIGLGDQDPRIIIANIIRVALGFLGIVAVGLIMYAGWLWMTANGNEENIEKAKKILTGAVIGLVIILMSFAIATYILGKILDATGGGGSETCTVEGEMRNCGCGGTQTCMSGTWGSCIGSTCGSDVSPFYVTSTLPKNGALNVIRNAKIRFSFYSAVDSGTVSLGVDETFKITNAGGVEIAGSQITDGRRISFTPDGVCPDNPCGAANCLPQNEAITVEAVSGAAGILSAGGQQLACSLEHPCRITFNTGELIDCEDPKVSLDFDQICMAPNNEIYADSSDDSGVDSITFYINNSLIADIPSGNNPIVNLNGDRYFNTRAEFLPSMWDGIGAIGDSINIKATANDVDDHSASDSKNVILRAGHCCNNTKDGDEEGIDCGGSCGACDGAACDIGDDNPDVCTTPDDTKCASGFCDDESCVCVSAPIIDWVSPAGGFCNQSQDIFCGSNNSICNALISGDTCNLDAPNGAAGNLVTIGGRYFGATQGSGTVVFNDGENPPIQAVLAGCVGSWKDRSIVVKVPAGLKIGIGTAITVKANNGFFDTSNNNFVVNNLVRPGICAINPEQGFIGEEVAYEGIRLLNNQGYFGNVNSASLAESIFNNNTQGTTTVPNVKVGKTTTFTKSSAEGANSNFLPFTKNAELKTGPQITSFSPIAGKEGQYITISGSGFGSANKDQVGRSHNVYFDLNISDNTEPAFYGTKANFSFPEICSDSLWKDNQIIVKVPTGLTNGSDYFLVVDAQSWDAAIDTSKIIPAGGVDDSFKYDESLSLSPSLCLIAPETGPNNEYVSLWGEYFGAGATAKVKFQLDKFQGPPLTITQDRGADRINTTVPQSAISGPVRVIQGINDKGNSLNFEVKNCKNKDDCGGTVCCLDGSYRAGLCAVKDDGTSSDDINDCYKEIGSSVYEWDFSTGQGGNVGDPCKTDSQTGACDLDNSGCKSGLICEASSCTCQPTGTCAGYSLNECTEGGLLCPNSPGACQALNEKITANSCDNNYCNSEYPMCAGACSYDTNKNLCVSASTCDEENNNLISGYSAVCEKVSGITGKWQINTGGASCPSGTFLDTNGQCTIGTVGNPTACSACADGLICSDGECVINKEVCADGFSCDAGLCTKAKDSCECCCRVAEEEADCCLGLTCEPNLCGADDPNYGQCTGCTIETGGIPDQDLSNAACNCDGISNKVCNMDFDKDSDGTKEGKCEDGGVVNADCSGLLCSDTGFSACANPQDFCDPDEDCTCQPIEVGTPCDIDINAPSCQIDTTFCQSANPNLYCDPDGGDDVAGNADDCTCQQSGNEVGEDCEVPETLVCDPNACKTGYGCMSEIWPLSQGNCGNCCCTVGAGDNCGLINPNLVCNYAEDVGGCADSNQGVAPDFGLCCGCSSDGQCGGDVSAVGCSDDTCCRPRPNIINEEETNSNNGCQDLVNTGDGIFESCLNDPKPFNKTENICRNASIEATFDKKMDIKSFSGNVVVVGDYGFGVCPEGTQYILAQNENKGFFAKLLAAPVKFVKKIFYLLNPEARALTVNFCAIPGKVSGVHNADETTTLSFSPDDLLDGNRKYYAIIKGDSNIGNSIDEGVKDAYGVSMVDTWPDIDGGGLAESDRTFNGTVYYGYAWSFETMSALSANSGVCKIDRVIVSPESYLFNTTKDDVKENDANFDSSDFDKKSDGDKVFSAAAVSADGQPLSKTAVYTWDWAWTSQPNMVVNFDAENPFASVDAKQLFAAQDGVTDGKAVITATANVSGTMAGESEFYSAEADVWVFVCENPWPAIDSVTGRWAPWSDKQANCGAFAGGQCPNTNYDIYYCRDAAGVGTVDDLPAILSKSTIIRGKSTDNKILKEFYFFREAAPAVSGGINLQANNISTTTDGTVALSWNAPAGGADGYKIYYGTSSGNYDFYVDVKNSRSEEISGLTLNKNYYFSVTAYFATGAESGYSSEVSIEIKDSTAPNPPVSLNLEKACDGEATISWSKNTEDTAGYKVYYGSTQSGSYGSSADAKDATSVTLKGLNNNTKYYLAVKAYDASGNESMHSNEVAFTVVDSSNGTCFNPNDGLVLWQSFDSADISGTTAKDKSGKGNDGTIIGATQVSGKVGQALSFNGSSNSVEIPRYPFNDSEGTMAAWIFVPAAAQSGDGTILRLDSPVPWSYHMLQRDRNSNNISYTVHSPNKENKITAVATSGAWNYVAVTYSIKNNKIEMYINGEKKDEDEFLNTTISVDDLYIGSYEHSGNFFNSLIDEARIYNRVLGNSDIKALYDQSSNISIQSSKIAEWKFEEGSGTAILDSVGSANGALSTAGSWSNSGRVGKAVYLDGSSVAGINFSLPDIFHFGFSDVSVSLWTKTEYIPNLLDNPSIFMTGRDSGRLWIYINSAGEAKINTFFRDGSNSFDFHCINTVAKPINDGQWHNIIATFQKNGFEKLYVDNVLVGQMDISSAAAIPWTENIISDELLISSGANGYYKGYVDEFTIYNKAFTANEVNNLYSSYK
jgi:hypothetical protein